MTMWSEVRTRPLITPKPAAKPVGRDDLLHLEEVADPALQRDGVGGVADQGGGARAMHAVLADGVHAVCLIAGWLDRLR
jgi:hypothetical protein